MKKIIKMKDKVGIYRPDSYDHKKTGRVVAIVKNNPVTGYPMKYPYCVKIKIGDKGYFNLWYSAAQIKIILTK